MQSPKKRAIVMEFLELRRLLSTIYVDAIAPGPTHNGSSWTNAYTDLQQALSAATSGTTIEIAQGTYKPTATTSRTISFNITSSIFLYGGYAGYGTASPDARNPSSYQTILSGDIGNIGDNSDNSYHVVDINAYQYSPTLDGFTILGGNSNATQYPNNEGGGLYITLGNATINDCTFAQNNAIEGGGLYVLGQTTAVMNCTFSNNSASDGAGAYLEDENNNAPSFMNCVFTNNLAHEGGGVYNASSLSKFTDCTFSDNEVSYTTAEGGGMYNYMASPTLTNCVFESNSAVRTGTLGSSGGGLENAYSPATLIDCSFIQNSADAGGGMADSQGGSTLNDCTFDGNTTDSSAGGGLVLFSSSEILNNCLFVGNTARTTGGAIQVSGSKPTITNCTFDGNGASTSGNAIEADSTSIVTLNNSIVWNQGPLATQIKTDSSSAIFSTYSDLFGFAGTGDIATDPLFIRNPSSGPDGLWGTSDDDYGDLYLQFTSAGVDAGSNSLVRNGISTDLDGNTRIFDFPGAHDPGAIVDMGAYELGYNLDEIIVPFDQTLALPSGGYTFTASYINDAYGDTLDIKDDTVIIPYSAGNDPASLYASNLELGYNGGQWNGTGIISSATLNQPANVTSVGYYDNGSSVTIRRTWYGDANVDGVINADDLSLMMLAQTGAGPQPATRWQDGNFNYGTQITADDWSKFAYVNAYAKGQNIATAAPEVAQVQLVSANNLDDLLN
ncbi:MAG TPA: right-handed parallel beta-helix repeat-containing protein [Tepidisphaeraceae bacterium]|jgi:predicted outer membrane repeat protein